MADVKYPLEFSRINQIQLKIECFFISLYAETLWLIKRSVRNAVILELDFHI